MTLLLLVNRTRVSRLREAVLRSRALALVIAAPLVLGLLAFMPAVLSRALGGGGESLRQTLTAVSFRMFATAPLTGSGPGTWAARRASFTQPGETDYYIPHAHNVYAQVFAELGIVGVAATVVVVACLAWLIWSGLRRTGAVTRPMAIAAVFGLVFLGFQQLVDSHMNLLSVLFGVAIPIAWLDAKSPKPIPLPFGLQVPRLAFPAAGGLKFIAILGATAFLVWSNVKALDSQRIAEFAAQENWPAAYEVASRLAADDPGITAYHFVLGLSAARVGEIAQASRELELAATKDDFPQGWLNVAAVRLESGDLTGTREAIDRALRLGRQDVAIVFPSGVILLKLGDDAEAIRAFVGALALTPSLASDPYWRQPSVSGLATQVFDQAIARSGAGSAFEIALLTGRTDQASQTAARLDPAQHAFLDQVLRAWNGANHAYEAVRARAAANPNDTQALAWSARLAHRSGDFALSESYRRQLDLMNVFTAIGNGMDLRVAPNGGTSYSEGQPQPGLNNGWSYGVFTYLRQIPVDIFVPGVPHLVLQ